MNDHFFTQASSHISVFLMSPIVILIAAVLIGVSWQLLSSITTNLNMSMFLQLIKRRTMKTSSTSSQPLSIAFIFAHPDDEAMFFTPILHALKEEKSKPINSIQNNNNNNNMIQIHFLCVSQGDYDKLGGIREKEMHASAKFYGADSCHVFNDKRCLDGPKAEWDVEWVAREIVQKKAIEELQASVIFTFDDFGVSGHTNHRQVHNAVKMVADEHHKRPSQKQVVTFFKLASLPIWRKYSSIFGVIVRNVVDRFLHASNQNQFGGEDNESEGNKQKVANFTVIVPPSEGFLSMRGLWNHYSQFVWFRFFYVMLASYSYENIFDEI